jgi:hypothetical protein
MDNIEAGGIHKPQDLIATTESAEKEQRWKQVSNELNQVTDALGKPIDVGIFDTVVALNLFDIHTTQSCEGHPDRGVLAPWVEIQAPETDQIKALKQRANQTMDTIEHFEMQEKPDEELEELYQEYHRLSAEARRPQLEEKRKAMRLLADFYQNRRVAYDQVLTIQGNRLESQGAQLQEIISPEERIQKLHAYQEEMKTFTAFLMKKYFSEVK